jgi:tetratricopeptide (TPR) repeat protein
MLDELEHHLRTAHFDAALQAIRSVRPERLPTDDKLTLLRFRCIEAEVADYFGKYQQAEAAIAEHGREAESTLAALPKPGAAAGALRDRDRQFVKQSVWTVIHWSYTFYRKHNYKRSEELLNLCRMAIGRIATDGDLCYAAQARVAYALGLIHRQQHEYGPAKSEFTACIAFANRALEANRERNGILAEYTVAKALALGLGWICYTEAAMQLAEPLLLSARTLLSGIEDRIISKYVDVVHACIQRAKHGHNHAVLQKVIQMLQSSYDTFTEADHVVYKVIAGNELALAYLQQARMAGDARREDERNQALDIARGYADEVIRLAPQDIRWKCSALVIRSRVCRHRNSYREALDFAETAVRESATDVFSSIDAYIAVGEARLALQDHKEAAEAFGKALALGGENPKVRAVCHLHLADTFIEAHDERKANEHFDQWLRVRDLVENAFVIDLARSVAEKMNALTENFFVSMAEKKINADDEEALLHGFLVRWARNNSNTDEEAARLLGKTKATMYNWERTAAKVAKRRRRPEESPSPE